MKGFKTYVITKKSLIKSSIIIAATACAVISGILLAKCKKEPYVSAFSPTAERILNDGMKSGKSEKTLRERISDVIGFESDKPTSVIGQASASIKQLERESTPTPTPKKSAITKLPTHSEIAKSLGLDINNATNYDVDIDDMCKSPLDVKLNFKSAEVLIVHTHTTECYIGDEMTGEAERTTNEKYNMCRIGDIVSDTLNSYGIKTIHDKTIHDYPSYQGAYTRALKTIEKNVKENPEIKVVLDIHRDAYVYADGSKLRVATDDGAAKVMLVLGTDSMGLDHPFWKSNLTLAAKVQNAAKIMYPDLMRPINLRRERFNMHMSKGSLLIEVGSNGNSLEESEKSAVYIGNALAAALING